MYVHMHKHMQNQIYKDVYMYIHSLPDSHMCTCVIAVAQLSINGTTVDSVTDRDNEPQYHVKEDAGSITLYIRVESFPEEKDKLTIDYFTSHHTACKCFTEWLKHKIHKMYIVIIVPLV